MLTTRQMIEDPRLLGAHPAYAGGLASWSRWLDVHDMVDGAPLTPSGRALWDEIAGGRPYNPPAGGWDTILMVAPRRIGKSEFVKARIAAAASTPGPRGTYCALIAQDTRSATRALLAGTRDFFRSPSLLADAVLGEVADELRLSDCTISVWPGSRPQSLRGLACRVVAVDEGDFLSTENGSDVLRAVLQAARPTLATVPGSRLICISSPGRHGSTYHALHSAAFGQDDPHTLALHLPLSMNPALVGSRYVDSMRAGDAIAFANEVEGRYVENEERNLMDSATLMACVVEGRVDIPPDATRGRQFAFIDPAAGAKVGDDHFALAVGGRDPETARVVIACLRKWAPPFSVEAIAASISETCRSYGIRTLYTDSFGSGLLAGTFARFGLTLERAKRTTSDAYLDSAAAFSSCAVELPDPQCSELASTLMADLRSLTRRPAGDRDRVSAPRTRFGHADLASSVAGLICIIPARKERPKCAIRAEHVTLRSAPAFFGGMDGGNPAYGDMD